MHKWKCKKSKIILKNKFFKVREDVVELPTKKYRKWVYWDTNDSTMVIGITSDKKLIMIKQYRYLANNFVIEFPAGGLHDGEKIKNGAKREFEEETGFKCDSLIKLGSFYETYGQLNRQIHIFFSNKITASKQNLDSDEEGDENIKVKLIDFNKTVDLVRNNKILATSSSLAILLLKEKVLNKEITL